MVHVSEVAFDQFKGVKVDGATLTAGQYEARAGSTVVTLQASYLDTLAIGQHTLVVELTSGSISDVFTITGASASGSAKPMPNTGAEVGPGIALGLVALGFGLVLIGAGGVASRRPVPRRAR